MLDLSRTQILSFEIGDSCNLKRHHKKCPINCRQFKIKKVPLTTEKILESICMAKELNFSGYIAFHYYNEPLLYKEKMLEIINTNGKDKYLLWTNGELLDKDINNNDFLNLFSLINITCYSNENLAFFKELQKKYKHIKIITADLDDRLDVYESQFVNQLACKRPFFELPIDYYGNVHMCCFDWNNEEEIGNINESNLKEVVLSEQYQRILRGSEKRLVNSSEMGIYYSPICLKCNHALLFIPKL